MRKVLFFIMVVLLATFAPQIAQADSPPGTCQMIVYNSEVSANSDVYTATGEVLVTARPASVEQQLLLSLAAPQGSQSNSESNIDVSMPRATTAAMAYNTDGAHRARSAPLGSTIGDVGKTNKAGGIG